MRRVIYTVVVWLLATAPGVRAEDALTPRQARTFGQVCAQCHAVAGVAPLVGEEVEWARRREQGLETLLAHTVSGLRHMPPLGTCGFCSEEDLRALVVFLSGW